MTIKDTEADPAPWVRASPPSAAARPRPERPRGTEADAGADTAGEPDRDEDDLLLSGWFAPA